MDGKSQIILQLIDQLIAFKYMWDEDEKRIKEYKSLYHREVEPLIKEAEDAIRKVG